MLPDLTERRRQPEIMDQPGIDPQAHVGALVALERINFWSASTRILWRELARCSTTAPLRVLDIATGAGDIPLRLWHRAQRAGLPLTIAGCDRSATAIDHARGRAAQQGAAVQFFTLDALADALPTDYDLLTCSLFLHHLDAAPAIELLRRLAAAARRLVLVNDLERSRLGYALAWAGTRLLSRSAVAHTDGPLSVAGAFTRTEALALASQAGLTGATVSGRWPCRFLLKWERAAAAPTKDEGSPQ